MEANILIQKPIFDTICKHLDDESKISYGKATRQFEHLFLRSIYYDEFDLTNLIFEKHMMDLGLSTARKFQRYIDWRKIYKQQLSEDFMREFADELDWYDISGSQKLSEGFIREFAFRVNWYGISCSQKLTEEFIWEFAGYVDWEVICRDQTISEDTIRKAENIYQYVLNWCCISRFQKLSEEFMREFADRLDWDDIFQYQSFTEEFLEEFSDRGNMGLIRHNRNLSAAFVSKFESRFDESDDCCDSDCGCNSYY